MWRLLETVERLIWLIVAAVIGGTWVGYEAITDREIPGHAHPVFAALMAAALTWGGIDLRKTKYWRHKLLGLTQDPAELRAADAEKLASKIALLESEDPLLVKAIQLSALRDAGVSGRAAKAKRRPSGGQASLRTPETEEDP